MLNASRNEGGAGAGFGAAMGAALGMGARQPQIAGPWGTAPAQAAPTGGHGALPPPLPGRTVETVWHIAVGDHSEGPYGRGHLGRLAAEGKFGRDTLVWAPGQDGWKPADEVHELAQLFTMQPPPVPLPKPQE